jgi:hypothetical protein
MPGHPGMTAIRPRLAESQLNRTDLRFCTTAWGMPPVCLSGIPKMIWTSCPRAELSSVAEAGPAHWDFRQSNVDLPASKRKTSGNQRHFLYLSLDSRPNRTYSLEDVGEIPSVGRVQATRGRPEHETKLSCTSKIAVG